MDLRVSSTSLMNRFKSEAFASCSKNLLKTSFEADTLESIEKRDLASSCFSNKNLSARFFGKGLVGISMGSFPVIVALSFVLGPFALLGLIPVLLFGILGSVILCSRSENVSEPPENRDVDDNQPLPDGTESEEIREPINEEESEPKPQEQPLLNSHTGLEIARTSPTNSESEIAGRGPESDTESGKEVKKDEGESLDLFDRMGFVLTDLPDFFKRSVSQDEPDPALASELVLGLEDLKEGVTAEEGDKPKAKPQPPRRRYSPPKDLPPFVPGQPIGLQNRSNDCWANASFQLFMRCADLKERISGEIPEIEEMVQAYKHTQEVQGRFLRTAGSAERKTEVVGGERFRELILSRRREEGELVAGRDQNPETCYISASSDKSEDAACFFESLLGNAFVFFQRIGNRVSTTPHFDWAIHLSPGEEAVDDFEGLLYQALNEDVQDLEADAQVTKSMQFNEAPGELLLHVKRFFQVYNAETDRFEDHSNRKKVQVPSSFELPGTSCINRMGGSYSCDGFIVHVVNLDGRGREIGAHYVAYVKDDEGRWWLCNDRAVTSVTEDRALARMPFGYIYHFSANT